MRTALEGMKKSFCALVALCALCICLYSYHGLTNTRCNCPSSYYFTKRSPYIQVDNKSVNIQSENGYSMTRKLTDFFNSTRQSLLAKKVIHTGINGGHEKEKQNNTWITSVLENITIKEKNHYDMSSGSTPLVDNNDPITRHASTNLDKSGSIYRLMAEAGLIDDNIANMSNIESSETNTSLVGERTKTGLNSSTPISSGYTEDKAKCQPVKRVFFLKTHKTGGSTLTNILNRFADNNQLNVVLPKDPSLYNFEWPNKFRLSYTRPLYGLTPNILCNHARFNKRAVNWLFPANQSAYITILRNPTEQYESTFNFMQFGGILGYNMKNPLRYFLKSKPNISFLKKQIRNNPALYLIKNPMFFDLGLDFRYHENMTAVDEAIKDIEKTFKIVLLMEYFDESMVLLKRTLCWRLEDVLHFKLNQRRGKTKAAKLSKLDKIRIKRWNKADVKLYEHFNRTFWRKIQEEGMDFYDELKLFKLKKQQIAKDCLAQGEYLEEAYGGVYVKGFSLRNDVRDDVKPLCTKMMTKELSYLDYWRKVTNRKLSSIEEPEEQLSLNW